jgi:hypothetical protein
VAISLFAAAIPETAMGIFRSRLLQGFSPCSPAPAESIDGLAAFR